MLIVALKRKVKNNIYIGLYNDKLDIIIHESNNANIYLKRIHKKKKKKNDYIIMKYPE